MGEGLSAAEVGKEIAEHRESRDEHRSDVISIVEAVLLATVALFAGWSGFASSKWSTESRLDLAQFQVAFDAWRATKPDTNPNAPKGPTYMPQYKQPEEVRATALDATADAKYLDGQRAATSADDYVRITVYLATVLFLVGISGHFRLKAARYGLVTVGVIVLVLAVATLTTLPGPPT